MRLRLLALALLAALLPACAEPTEGVVHDKDWRAAFTNYVPGCYQTVNGVTASTCTVPVHYPERYRLWLCPHGAAERSECGWRNVPSVVWAEYEVGEYYEAASA